MSHKASKTSDEALKWLIQKQMVLKGTRKDPETFANVQGFVLSQEMREAIGTNLVELVAKSSRKKKSDHVTLKDAFLAATIAAIFQKTKRRVGEDKLTECAKIIFALLPIERLEQAGLADRPLRVFSRDRSLVERLERILDH